MTVPILEVRGLQMHFPLRRSLLAHMRRDGGDAIRAVDGVDLVIRAGESVGLVGESGCGKSTLGRCITGLHEPTAGQVLLNGRPVEAGLRGSNAGPRVAQIIFQDPYSSLNPRISVRQAVTEVLRVHHRLGGQGAERRFLELLGLVRLEPAGGQRLPSAAIRRAAPAREHCSSAGSRARAARRRRAGIGT